MARMTKQEEAESVRVHYGIHRPTKSVQSVWEKRSGKLVMTHSDLTETTSFIAAGRSADHELKATFYLSDTFSVLVSQMDSESTKRRIAELRAKAAAL